jgi:hypothetical protein
MRWTFAVFGCLLATVALASGPVISGGGGSSSAVNSVGKSAVTLQAPSVFADGGFLIVNGRDCAYTLSSDSSGNFSVNTTSFNCGGQNEVFSTPNELVATNLTVGNAFQQGNVLINGPSGSGGYLKATGNIAGYAVYADGGSLEVAGPNCTYTLSSDVSGHLVVGSIPANCNGPGNYFAVSYANISGGLYVDTVYSNGGEAFNAYYGVQIGNAGTGLKVVQAGQATLSTGGTVTVTDAAVTATSVIELTGVGATNVGTLTVGTISAGASFVINSTTSADRRVVNWVQIN